MTNQYLNMDDIKEFSVVPAGVYRGSLIDADVIMSSPSGDPYIKTIWEAQVKEGDEYITRKFWKNVSLSRKAQWGLKQLCIAVNDPSARLPIWYENGSAQCNEQELRKWILSKIGVVAELTIVISTYQGEEKNDVKKLNAASNSKNPSTPGVKRV